MEIVVFFGIGFFAQLIDGALGMAFGAISTTALLSFGLSPLHASAIVHTAEVATTGASVRRTRSTKEPHSETCR